MIVTNVKWKTKAGTPRVGFYMDSILAENLAPTKKFLEKDFGIVGLITGSGKTRCGKTRVAFMVATYQAWIIAGGEMDFSRNPDGKLKYPSGRIKTYPTKPLKFTLDNVVFNPKSLIEKSIELPEYSIIIDDEGRAGNESVAVTSRENRLLSQFFDECSQRNQVILIVLPDFFKLNADLCTTRSLFLINVYLDDNFNRGFFSYFNETQKNFLYSHAKKKVGVTSKYLCGYPTFRGKFIDFCPFDVKEYDKKKLEALKEKRNVSKREINNKIQRDCMITLYKDATNKTYQEIADDISKKLQKKVSDNIVEHSIRDFRDYIEKIEELNLEKGIKT